MRLLEKFYKLVDENLEHNIITVEEKAYTYDDIKKRISMWKCELKRQGVTSRAKVIVYIKEIMDFIGIYFALCEIDCIMIPIDISAKQTTIPEVVNSSKAHFAISLQELSSEVFQQETPLTYGCFLYKTRYEEKDTPDDIMQFLYTSGTTGLPKCVMFSRENMANNIIELAKVLSLSKQDVIYTPISLMLPAALNTVLLPALLSGTKIYVSGATVPGSILQNIIEQEVTVFFSVPFYYKLLAVSKLCTEETWKKVRICLTSSAYLEEDVFRSFYEKTNKGLHSIYCSSEAGTISYNASNDIDSLCKSVGVPLSGCEVFLINKNAEGLGEIVVSGGMVSLNYYENDELNKKVYQNGWVRTGDLGYIHENGNLEIMGRLSENINIAGNLVNPLEVENTILKIQNVKEVIAYKYHNNMQNEMLGVKVVIHEGTSLSEKEIIEYCNMVLPNYKVPKKVQFVDMIDTGRYGKKKRHV